jgi:hypothetical protein
MFSSEDLDSELRDNTITCLAGPGTQTPQATRKTLCPSAAKQAAGQQGLACFWVLLPNHGFV